MGDENFLHVCAIARDPDQAAAAVRVWAQRQEELKTLAIARLVPVFAGHHGAVSEPLQPGKLSLVKTFLNYLTNILIVELQILVVMIYISNYLKLTEVANI